MEDTTLPDYAFPVEGDSYAFNKINEIIAYLKAREKEC